VKPKLKPKDWPLVIFGKRYRVEWKPASGKDSGECFNDKCLILVNPEIHPEQQRDTLLHEVCHAIDIEMDTGMRERQIRLLATGLLQFMRSNPEVIRWLCETDADTKG
jgi:hypothetical protein